MISIIKTSDFNVKLKATIHSSGRLGFTADTAVNLNLSDDTFVKFAKDNENENELFMIFVVVSLPIAAVLSAITQAIKNKDVKKNEWRNVLEIINL